MAAQTLGTIDTGSQTHVILAPLIHKPVSFETQLDTIHSRILNVATIAELCVNRAEACTTGLLGYIYIAIFPNCNLVFGLSRCVVPAPNIAFPFRGYNRCPSESGLIWIDEPHHFPFSALNSASSIAPLGPARGITLLAALLS